MKKNAFTLIELIATIGLLGMLATITITVSVRKINETKEKARDTMIESIKLAAEKYVTDYEEELQQFKNNDNIYISLQTLVEKEYFTESLVDPTTKKSIPITNEVYITRDENGEISSTYDINQRQNPKLTLIGSYNEYVEEGKEYVEKGVKAITPSGEDVSSNVIITGSVDTTIPNTYKITYELDNEKITRNVIVFSKNISSEEILKASTYIERLYKTNNYQNDELYNPKVTYEGKEYDTGIRYRGANPNNYVYFNCEDKDANSIEYGNDGYDYANNCEIWRIIGVFEVDNGSGKVEKRVKLVRNEMLLSASWDSSERDVNSGYGINEWSESDLNKMLNGYYLSTTSECYYCNDKEQQICNNSCINSFKVLSDKSVNMIDDVRWYTAAIQWNLDLTLFNIYMQERGDLTGKQLCTQGEQFCNDIVPRKKNNVDKIGLIYVSDYGYATTNNECYNKMINSGCAINNWLTKTKKFWTISPIIDESYNYVAVYASSIEGNDRFNYHHAFESQDIYPSLYLKSSVKIKGGNGSSTSPYILAI